ARFRNYGSVLRQGQCHPISVQIPPDEFVVCCHRCHRRLRLARIQSSVLRPRCFAAAVRFTSRHGERACFPRCGRAICLRFKTQRTTKSFPETSCWFCATTASLFTG